MCEIMWFYSETCNEHADGRNHSSTLFFNVKWSAHIRKQTHVCIETGFVYKMTNDDDISDQVDRRYNSTLVYGRDQSSTKRTKYLCKKILLNWIDLALIEVFVCSCLCSVCNGITYSGGKNYINMPPLYGEIT